MLWVLVAVTFGCQPSYDDLPDAGGEPMVYGAISVENQSFVVLQEVNGLRKNIKSNTYIENASVRVIESASQSYVGRMKEVQPGHYFLDTSLHILAHNSTYYVEIVLSDGHLIKSADITIPALVPIDSITIDAELVGQSSRQPFLIHYTCHSLAGVYISAGISSKLVDDDRYIERRIVPSLWHGQLANCAEGTAQHFLVLAGLFYTNVDLDTFLEKYERLELLVYSVTEELVRFGKVLDYTDGIAGGDQFEEPILLPGNLDGAFGVIGGYEKSCYTLK